jgi:DNA-3-methyladenine glycosylase I
LFYYYPEINFTKSPAPRSQNLTIMPPAKEKNRCPWCLGFDQYIEYHDKEWGLPVHDDRVHFEFLILEGAQAGLSWSTILKKREGYRKAFRRL